MASAHVCLYACVQTRLSNPHFRPEVQAQCTLVNFTVTSAGLEDQLLACVVQHEMPGLEDEMKQVQVRRRFCCCGTLGGVGAVFFPFTRIRSYLCVACCAVLCRAVLCCAVL